MSEKPRVTATHQIEAHTESVLCEPSTQTSPGVVVRVEFDLHDHEAALAALDIATANVRAQIEETT
jgi:hypothetical protein